MSFCRFSSNDFQCDLYVYADARGFYRTEVAANRVVFKNPLPPAVSSEGKMSKKQVRVWSCRCQKVMAIVEQSKRVPIGLRYDGRIFEDRTAGALLKRLVRLLRIGYQFPPSVLESVQQEIDEGGKP